MSETPKLIKIIELGVEALRSIQADADQLATKKDRTFRDQQRLEQLYCRLNQICTDCNEIAIDNIIRVGTTLLRQYQAADESGCMQFQFHILMPYRLDDALFEPTKREGKT
jgi:hypothetical protein